jgi:chromosomal replication initiator protein
VNNLDVRKIWDAAVSSLSPEISSEDLELWIKPVEPLRIEESVLCVKVPNKFFSDWIRDHYQQKLESSIKASTGQDLALDYSVSRELKDLLPKSDPLEEIRPQSDFKLSELNPRYTFSTFVVGTSNRLAHATAEAIAKNPGRQYNPFFIYGGAGLGKTHLLHAIGHSLSRTNHQARVLYTTAEQFVNEYIDSVRYEKTDVFRSKYRNLDCLLFDDIQFIIAKGRSEEEFFYTFNALFDSHKQIVITSDRAPKEMAPSEQRLISRFMWGQVVDIKPPDLETRIAILRNKAESERIFMPADVILFVASAIKANIRELEGSLIRLSAFSSLTGSPLTVDSARELLKDSLDTDLTSRMSMETIQKIVAEKYSIDIKELKSRSRVSEVAFPRQLAMYIACSMTDLSTTDIGRAFGGRDHTTVIHARDKIKGMIEKDPFFLENVNRLIDKMKSVESY